MTRAQSLSIALFVGLWSSALPGCDEDTEYVCVADGDPSQRGCFVCRDEVCEEQPPPTRPPCLDPVDCAVGGICTDLGCVAACREELDCALGTTCIDDLCLNPVEPTPGRPDNPLPNPDPEPPVPEDREDRCQFNFECSDARICIDGQCLFTCLDTPCPGEQDCVDGAICRPCPEGGCPTVAACDDDVDCSDEEYCEASRCVPDTRAARFCPDNACQPGRVCRRGQCRSVCQSDRECALLDASIRFCAPVADEKLCVRGIELLADCQLNIDCGLGEECVDGSCVDPESMLMSLMR